MLLTATSFQPATLPYVVIAVVGLVGHDVTAVPTLALVMAATACVPGAASTSVATTASNTIPQFQSPLVRDKQDTASRRRARLAAPKRRRQAAALVSAILSDVGGAVNECKGVSADVGIGAGSARPIEQTMLLDFLVAAQRSPRSLICPAHGWSPPCTSPELSA